MKRMKQIFLGIFSLGYFLSGNNQYAFATEKSQVLIKRDAVASYKGPEEFFTGDVVVEALFPSNETAMYSGAYVTFSPKARSNWHTHPTGQHFLVISGVAWTQDEHGNKIEAHPGDTIWCPEGVKHWHGASPNGPMTHLALTGVDRNGKNVEWMEKVSDEQYEGKNQ